MDISTAHSYSDDRSIILGDFEREKDKANYFSVQEAQVTVYSNQGPYPKDVDIAIEYSTNDGTGVIGWHLTVDEAQKLVDTIQYLLEKKKAGEFE